MTPERWKRAGVFGGVTLVAWLAAWILMRQYVADLFVIPEGAELVSRDNILDPPAAGEGQGSDQQSGPKARAKANKHEYMSVVLKRNIFDSTNVGKAPTMDPGGDLTQTDLDVVLVATIVAEPMNQSSALIATRGEGESPRVYYLGDTLSGGAEIAAIRGRTHAPLKEGRRTSDLPELSTSMRGDPPSVILLNNGVQEVLWMTGEDYGKDAKPNARSSSSDGDLVTKAGPNKFIVEQSLIDQITADPEKLQSEVRVSAHKGSDGQTDGFRLSGIRRRSMFKQLGIKNGDIVHAVNGQSLTDANKAVEAYGSLQGVSSFTFEVTRRNERQVFEYEVR
jgi:membrane-associated protease RseP (regulator of RpoE activity)